MTPRSVLVIVLYLDTPCSNQLSLALTKIPKRSFLGGKWLILAYSLEVMGQGWVAPLDWGLMGSGLSGTGVEE